MKIETDQLATKTPMTLGGSGWESMPAEPVAISNPEGILVAGGLLYVSANNRIWSIDPVAHSEAVFAGDESGTNTDGTGTGAGFSDPFGLCIADSNLYVACFGSPAIRKVTTPGAVVTTLDNPVAGDTYPSLFLMFTATDGIHLWVSVSAD